MLWDGLPGKVWKAYTLHRFWRFCKGELFLGALVACEVVSCFLLFVFLWVLNLYLFLNLMQTALSPIDQEKHLFIRSLFLLKENSRI